MKAIKIFALLLGIVFTGWLIKDAGPRKIWLELVKLGPWSLLFLIPYIFTYIFDTLGWKYSFSSKVKVPFSCLFKVRLAGESINYTTPTAYVGGEPVKAMILSKKGIPMSHGMSSVIIAKFLMTVTEVVFIIIGIELAVASMKERGILYWSLMIFCLVFGMSLLFFLSLQKKGLGNLLFKIVGKIKFIRKKLEKKKKAIEEFDKVLADYYKDKKLAAFACLHFFAAWCCGAFEIYIVLKLAGQNISIPQIFAMETMFVAIKGAGFLVPGSIGIQEGGQVWTFAFFGFSKSIGLTFSILRRTREIIWIIMGLLCLSNENVESIDTNNMKEGEENEKSGEITQTTK